MKLQENKTTLITFALIGISMVTGLILTSLTDDDLISVSASSSETGVSVDGGVAEPGDDTVALESTTQSAPPKSPNYPAEGNNQQVLDGRLPGQSDNSMNTDPEQVVYLYNGTMFFQKPTESGNIKIENNPGNLVAIQTSFYLADTGELVYVSPLLYPNQYIEEDVLMVVLEDGTYEVNVVISAYDIDDLKLEESYYGVGTIVIEDKLFGIF